MNSQRDYFLKHLGIGEVWQLRHAEGGPVAVVELSDQISGQDVVQRLPNVEGGEGVQGVAKASNDTWEQLSIDIQACNACTLCSRYGKQMFAKPTVSPDLVLLFDWSELGSYDPVLANQAERLLGNIMLAAKGLCAATVSMPLLNAMMPSEATQIPLQTSAAGCGALLKRYLKLFRPKRVLVFGPRIATAMGVSSQSQDFKVPVQWEGLEIDMSPSIYDILQDSSLKRVVWQQLCRIASETSREV
ncbi:hypothetical protein RF679_08300 [Undibacterium cyanobacteriorum]|uniref:Uracil-DNA glycosylase-like domain-containing protein n=1 Tax=Undibacterium cyanobacteriorum TaxID=3073561 RepID=A0ABY9RM29_9BURK|nr:hypothetical protein [Undibacterium sp. 20NA77.5]WMW82265.1 hypothetical protein RF679_08300 [Undibacterium sp. 20NA77.5]